VEWVKSERDEAQKAAEASAARLKELETAASRQKGHRRDESKRAAKESKSANHRAEVGHLLHMHASALWSLQRPYIGARFCLQSGIL